MGYIESRKKIYAPIYADLVSNTKPFLELRERVLKGENIQIADLDGPKQGDLNFDPKHKSFFLLVLFHIFNSNFHFYFRFTSHSYCHC